MTRRDLSHFCKFIFGSDNENLWRLENLIQKMILAPKRNGETLLAAQHLAHVSTDHLVILDRGYFAHWLLALILSKW